MGWTAHWQFMVDPVLSDSWLCFWKLTSHKPCNGRQYIFLGIVAIAAVQIQDATSLNHGFKAVLLSCDSCAWSFAGFHVMQSFSSDVSMMVKLKVQTNNVLICFNSGWIVVKWKFLPMVNDGDGFQPSQNPVPLSLCPTSTPDHCGGSAVPELRRSTIPSHLVSGGLKAIPLGHVSPIRDDPRMLCTPFLFMLNLNVSPLEDTWRGCFHGQNHLELVQLGRFSPCST